jgi:hypothetical protein
MIHSFDGLRRFH